MFPLLGGASELTSAALFLLVFQKPGPPKASRTVISIWIAEVSKRIKMHLDASEHIQVQTDSPESDPYHQVELKQAKVLIREALTLT